ncbi:MAG TPA: UbiX family flavin prenyltransferase [Candidatus Kryptobacter bacterium]|nr:UbiX family flavin prenyltransferase [Candidatus Kryptobacter bacterium]
MTSTCMLRFYLCSGSGCAACSAARRAAATAAAWSASISSGSFRTEGMIVVPCSMKTLAGIAQGITGNLIERAADVTLKEGRRLVLVPRETPLNKIHLKNMLAAADAGARIFPAMPAFYQKPRTIADLADFVAARILALFDIETKLFEPWQK